MSLDPSTSPFTIAGKNCWEEHPNGPSRSLGRTNQWAKRLIRCLWEDHLVITQELRGQVYGLTYTPPRSHPDYGWLYVEDVEIEGMVGTNAGGKPTGYLLNATTKAIAYKYAMLTVTYKTMDWLVNQQLGSLAIDYSTQFVVLGNDGSNFPLKFVNTGNDVTETPGIPIVVMEFCIQRNQVAALPLAKAMTAAMNPLNSLPFPDLGLVPSAQATSPARQVRLTGLHTQRVLDTYGAENWNINFKFAFRSIPWDCLINPQAAAGSPPKPPFEQAVYKTDGSSMIPSSDLNLLLQP